MAHDVFISYSHTDQAVANAIVAGLESEGIRCWIAPRDVTPGQTWGEAIVTAIENSRIMVMVLSDNSNRSHQVLREVERATAKEVIIIPFRIEKIDPTGAMAYFLSAEHWLDALTPPLEKHINKLIQTVKAFLSGEQPPDKPFQSSPKKKKWLPYVIGMAAVLVVSIVGFLIFRMLNPVQNTTPAGLGSTPITPVESVVEPTVTTTAASSFELIGEYRTSHAAEGLFIVDNTLYLANGADNLMRMNVSNPTNPMPLDVYSAYGATEVAVENGVAYIIIGEDSKEFLVIDFNNNTSFTYSNHNSDLPWNLSHLAVQNGLVHITGHNYWGIIDLTDPGTTKELWSWEPSTNSGVTCTVVLDGDIAYIGGGWAGLYVFNISDPSSPELIGGYDTPNWIVGMSLSGDNLFLSLGDTGLLALDVSDPSRPIMMDTLVTDGYVMESSATEDLLYITYLVMNGYDVAESGVYAVDITDPTELAITATYTGLHEASDIQAWGDAVFVTDRPWGVAVLKLSP
ncbi:MAG: TIR domain-containing protein [Anaerolineaceae bacterium]|nr:TIR domain-containing protein [Anaerolineaceae bacterium]